MVLDSRKWDARYGPNLLASHGPGFKSYIGITSPSAWAAVARHLPHAPRALEFQQGMGERYLAELLARLPEAELVLAIGGGSALDVGKYVAWKLSRPLVMIPTIVSTGSVFQSPVAVRRSDGWEMIRETVAPEYLLFDVDVIRSAPPHLNRAGMGECVCFMAAVGSWRWWVDQSLEGLPWDQGDADATVDWVRDRVAGFAATLDASGQPNAAGIRIAAEVNRERYDLATFRRGVAHSIDHTFVGAFEWLLGRELIHGEGVSLGALINAFVYDWGFAETKALLDTCRIRYRPAEIGCTPAEVRKVLARLNDLNDKMSDGKNWFHHNRLGDQAMENMMAAIEA